ERLTGSWFERLLAQRRTRELFFAIFILLMISVQLIGPFLNRYGDAAAPWAIRLLPYLSFLPPALVGKVIVAAATKDLRGVFLNLGAICLYVVLFSALLWRRFASEYSGEELSETPRSARLIRTIAKPQQLGDTLRLLSPQLVAVISKEFRYLMRNGFAALLLLLPPLLVFVL